MLLQQLYPERVVSSKPTCKLQPLRSLPSIVLLATLKTIGFISRARGRLSWRPHHFECSFKYVAISSANTAAACGAIWSVAGPSWVSTSITNGVVVFGSFGPRDVGDTARKIAMIRVGVMSSFPPQLAASLLLSANKPHILDRGTGWFPGLLAGFENHSGRFCDPV
jgi:hypothetical protein